MEKSYINIDPERNRYRFYTMMIQKNLFDQYYLVRHWGRIGRRGSTHIEIYPTLEESVKELNRIARIRKAHGYIDRGHLL